MTQSAAPVGMESAVSLSVRPPNRLGQGLLPVARASIRYLPPAAREWLWRHVVERWFFWRPHSFVAATTFGAKLSGHTHDLVQRYIYYFGHWEPNLSYWMATRLRPGDIFVDVGANVGYYALLASGRVGQSGGVVAIEASPEIFSILERNLRLNHVHNIRPINVAAADRRRRLTVLRGPDSNIGRTSTMPHDGLSVECEIDAFPVGELLQPDELRRVRLIKIDIEGAEALVLPGMMDVIDSAPSNLELVVEFHGSELRASGASAPELAKTLLERGFHAYSVAVSCTTSEYVAWRTPQAPTRVATVPEDGTIIFSRRDAATL